MYIEKEILTLSKKKKSCSQYVTIEKILDGSLVPRDTRASLLGSTILCSESQAPESISWEFWCCQASSFLVSHMGVSRSACTEVAESNIKFGH